MNTVSIITADEVNIGDTIILEDGTRFEVADGYWSLQGGQEGVKLYGVVKFYGKVNEDGERETLDIKATESVTVEVAR